MENAANLPVVLIVEDNAEMSELLAMILDSRGFHSHPVFCGQDALNYCAEQIPDIVLLDLTLPDLDGMQVCQKLKALPQMETVPVFICSARTDTAERVRCLDLGADDYICKPFDPAELIARMKALLRRFGHGVEVQGQKKPLFSGALKIDPALKQISWNKALLCTLTRSECDIFYLLVSRAGDMITRAEISQSVLGQEYDPVKRTIDMHIVQIRKKLGDELSLRLLTFPKKGYQWQK